MQMRMGNHRIIPYLCASLAMVFWSLSFIWYKEVLVLYKPTSLILMRLIISSIFLLIISLSLRWLNRMRGSDFKLFLLLAFFEPFLYFVGESHGINLIPSTLAAVIVSTIPLFTPIAAYYLLKERITTMNFFGILISMVGVGLVVFHKGELNIAESNPLGIGFMFISVFSAIAYSIVIRKLSPHYSVFSIVAYQNIIGIFLFLPLFFFLDYHHFISVTPTKEVLLPLLNLGIFASTFAFLLFIFALKKLGVNRANVFTNAIPVITAILAFYLLGEELTPVKVTGILVVVLGLFMSQLHRIKLRRLSYRKAGIKTNPL